MGPRDKHLGTLGRLAYLKNQHFQSLAGTISFYRNLLGHRHNGFSAAEIARFDAMLRQIDAILLEGAAAAAPT